MTICVEIVEDGLGLPAVFKNYMDIESRFDLERCEIYCGGPILNTGVLYLARAETLLDTIMAQEGSAMACIGMPPDAYKKPPLRLLVLDESQDLGRIVNDVNRIFFEYNTLEQKLQDAVNKGRSIQYMVDLMAPYFNGNELQVGGADFKIHGISNKVSNICLISEVDQPDSEGLIAPEVMTYFKNDINFSNSRDLSEPFIYGPSILICRLLCMNVFHNREYVCRVMVGEDRNPFRRYETGLLRFFTSYIQLIYDLSANRSDILPGGLMAEVFVDILNGASIEANKLDSCLQHHDWQPAGPFLCLSIMLSSRDYFNRTIQYYCHIFNREYKGCCFFEYDSGIVCVTNLQFYENSPENFLKIYQETFRDNYFRVGYSNTFFDLKKLRYHFIQAKIALRTGLDQHPLLWFHKFSDYIVSYLKTKVTEELSGEFLCAPEVMALDKYDKENNSDYLNTLRVYLNNHLNAVKTSKDLFIHRATMEYRLNRIKEITGIDFSDPEQVFYLNISIRVFMYGT